MKQNRLIDLVAKDGLSLLIPDAILDYLAEEYIKKEEKTSTFEHYATVRYLEDRVKVFSKMR